mgnify:CR=1 FL=1
MLSRGVSVIRNQTLIINLPGSPKAVKENLEYILPTLSHGLEILKGVTGECGISLKENINYMRVSVTDLCNLRCVYCMPKEGIRQISHDEILTFDEIARVCRIGAELGISRIKLTGGEPLVRKGIEDLAEMICRIPGIEQVTLTTNGILLKDQLPALQKGWDFCWLTSVWIRWTERSIRN